MGLSASVVNRWKNLTPSALQAVVLHVEALQLTPQGLQAQVPLAYELTLGHLLLAESANGQLAFLQVEALVPTVPPTKVTTPSQSVIVNAVWATTSQLLLQDVKHLYWVSSSAVLSVLSQSSTLLESPFALAEAFCPELTLNQEQLLSSTLLQSTDKLVLTETLVTLLMQLRRLGSIPIVLDVLGLLKQLDLPNIAVVQLGEAGDSFCSVEAYGVEALMGDCIAQLPEQLQAAAWSQYAHAFGAVTQPIEDLQTLNQYLEQSGAGLLHRQLQRLEQTCLFAKQPQASYFSVMQLVNQSPHAALWVVDLSLLPVTVLPWLVETLCQEITTLSLGKDSLALAVLNADYQTNISPVLNPENSLILQANLPFIQGQWRKKGLNSPLALVGQPQACAFNFSVELLAPEGVVLVQGEATNNLLLVLGLPAIRPLYVASHSPEALVMPLVTQSLPIAQPMVAHLQQPEKPEIVAKPIEAAPVPAPIAVPYPVAEMPVQEEASVRLTQSEQEDSWIYAAAQGSTAIHLMDKHSQNRFNTGATAREFLLQEQTHNLHNDMPILFAPLPISVEELSPEAQAISRASSQNSLIAEEDLPPIETLNLPEVELPEAFLDEDDDDDQAILSNPEDGEYYNSILGQMPPHWRKILERELKKDVANKPTMAVSPHPQAYPDQLAELPPQLALQPGEIALNEEIVANPHALHPCLPEEMMADIELFYATNQKTEENLVATAEKTTAVAIPASHLSGFLDAHLLDMIDEPATPKAEPIPEVEADWFVASTERMLNENVVPFAELQETKPEQEYLSVALALPVEEEKATVIVEEDHLPTVSFFAESAISSNEQLPVAHATQNSLGMGVADFSVNLEPETPFEANEQLLSQVFDQVPTVAMDAHLLQAAQAPLAASHPQGQWAVKPVESLPEEMLLPSFSDFTQPAMPISNQLFTVEQQPDRVNELAPLDFGLPTPATFIAEPVSQEETENAFPVFDFDLSELPNFVAEPQVTEPTSLQVVPVQMPLSEVQEPSSLVPVVADFSPPKAVVQALPQPEYELALALEPVATWAEAPPASSHQPQTALPIATTTTTTQTTSNTPDWHELSTQLDNLNAFTENEPAIVSSSSGSGLVSNPFEQQPLQAALPIADTSPAAVSTVSSHTIENPTVGMRVRHEEYGLGTVQAVVPLEERSVVSILFDIHGRRLLDPSLSALYPA